MIEVRTLSSMYAQIVNGVPKEQSQYVTDEETSAMWDTVSREVEEMKAADPNVVFSMPNEMPDTDDGEEDGAGAQPEGEPPAEPDAPPAEQAADETVEPPAGQTEPTSDGQDPPPDASGSGGPA